MIKNACLAVVAVIASITTCSGQNYSVRYMGKNHINVDGKANDPAWQKTDSINHFVSPWKSDPVERTVFRATYDDSFFYFFFQVEDKKIITSEKKEEVAVTYGDRIELFFSRDTSLVPYYCFEISPTGLVYDYEAKYHRKFFPKWHAEGVRIKTTVSDHRYTVEGAIPTSFIKTISGISNLRGNTIVAGLFRGDRDIQSASEDDIAWISWIRPAVSQPDFHIRSAFGTFTFE